MGINIPEMYPVWWETDVWDDNEKRYVAKVLGHETYSGRYPDFFNTVLKLEAPRTGAGYLKMAVKL